MRRLACMLWVGCLTIGASLQADLWTNQAGRVIEARLLEFDGTWVTLARTNGSRLRLPLTALRPADQRRVKLQLGESIAPPFVLAAYREARTVLDQFNKLPAQQRTEDARTKTGRMAGAVFDGRLKPRQDELKDPPVQTEVQRLRNLLLNP